MAVYYTDGSCEPNPGKGGYAVIKDMAVLKLGEEPHTTNIRMEGLAVLEALKDATSKDVIYTDSEFWVNVITKWSVAWEARGWKKKKGKIANLDIVKPACEAYKRSGAKLVWLRGHNGDEGNEMADHWANEARLDQWT